MIHDTYDTRKIQRRVDWITSSQYHLEVSSLIGVAVIVAHSLVCNKHTSMYFTYLSHLSITTDTEI
jgi:hypothetical protein